MSAAQIGFLSATLVAIISIIGQIVLHKVQRKDELVDKDAEQKQDILEHFQTIEDQLDAVTVQINSIKKDVRENFIIECRIRILRFADEILHNAKHSKESFDQVMEDITNYEHYCSNHPDFHNNKTVASIDIITSNFKERYEKNDFL